MSNFFIPLRDILFIDIETVSGERNYNDLSERMQKLWNRKAQLIDKTFSVSDLYFQKAAIYAEFGKVIVIGIGFIYTDDNKQEKFKVKTLHGDNEKELLQAFAHFIETSYKNKKLVFCAHNGKEFDYPYLCRRLLINGIPIPRVLNSSGKKPWQIEHLDTLELWKFGDRKNFTSLEILAAIFDIPGSKNDLDGSQVNDCYYNLNDLKRIADYCREDVLVTAQVYLRLHNKPLIQEVNVIKL